MTTPVKFIGRTRELEVVRNLLLEFGSTRFLFITADGGIGKTRLLEEILDRVRKGKYEPSYVYTGTRIALVQEFTDSEWSDEFIRGVTTMATELGATLEMTDAGHDPQRMAIDLAAKIDSQPDVIIVSLGSFPQVEAQVRRALDQGIPVLTFDNHLRGIEGNVIKVFQDDLEGVQLVSSLMLQDMNYRGKIAAVWSSDQSLQKRRRRDLEHLLYNYNLIHVIDVDCEMSSRSREDATEKIRRHLEIHPDTKAIWCVFNEFARGVVPVVKELGLRRTRVYSLDLCPSDKMLMMQANSPWRATAAIDPAEAGRMMVRLALQQTLPNPGLVENYYKLPLKLVTQETLRNLDEHKRWYNFEERWWTPELRARAAHVRTPKQSLYAVGEVIDFADPDLVVPGAIEQRLNEVAGEMAPESLILDLELLEKQNRLLQPETSRQQVQETLTEALNSQSRDTRLLLCFDTVELANREMLKENLLEVLCKTENVLVIFAGRPESVTEWLFEELSTRQLSSEIVRFELQPFNPDYSREYLWEKQRLLGLKLPEDLVNVLLSLSLGKPILLDLAIEYIFRELQFDKLPDSHTLAAMSPEERDQAAKSFEQLLVQHIRRLRNRMDQVVLRLSRIYPLSVEGIAALFQLPLPEAQQLFDEAQTYAFIRVVSRRGGEEIELHDEMRRLVEEYIWEKYDRNEAQRRRDSLQAMKFYRDQDAAINVRIKEYEAKIQELNQEIQALRDQPSFDEQRYITLRADLLKQELKRKAERSRRQVVTRAWVGHMFFAQYEHAFQEWRILVDKVRVGQHFDFVMALCQLIVAYVPQLSADQQYEYEWREARALIDLGQVREGIERLKQIRRRRARGNSDRQSNIDNLLGVAHLRLNQIERARRYQESCLKQIDPSRKGPRALVLNQIGYCYRLQIDVDPRFRKAAQRCYEEVILLASDEQREVTELNRLRMLNLIASANTNLANLYGMSRNYDRADVLLERAITIWRELGQTAESARAEITRGILARDQGFYDLSRQCLERAITLIPETDRSDKQYQAYFHLGWTEWFDSVDRTDGVRLESLERARRLLERSRSLAKDTGFERALPGISHQLASVLWRLGRETENETYCREGRKLNQTALELSHTLEDRRYYVDSLVGEAEFDLELQDDSRIKTYVKLLADYEQKYYFPLYYGRMRRIEAEFALRRGEKDQAFALYSKGIALINEHGGFGPYTVEKELRHLSQIIRQLSQAEANQYLHQMLLDWKRWIYKDPGVRRYDLVFWCENELQQLTLRT